jgi:hypothetical protein
MSAGEAAYLSMVVGAMVMFMLALMWVQKH